MAGHPSDQFGKTLSIADEVERFCLINLSADIEGIAMPDLWGEGYEERLQAARERLRHKHDIEANEGERQ